MDFPPDEILRYTVRPGDLLVCEGGDVGRAAIWEGPTNEIGYQKALHRVRPRSHSDLPKFIYYALFDSAKRGRFEDREKATIFHLTAEAFRRYRFAFPPLGEQRTIVAHLDALTAKLDMLEAHCVEHVARLREYRSSLISAAVTGQLDVGASREVA
jgi:type I restriction enzyme S subunit